MRDAIDDGLTLLAEQRRLFVPTEAAGNVLVIGGHGARCRNYDGRELIDLAGGLACLPFGYGDALSLDLLQAQARQLLHTGSEVVNAPSVRLAAQFDRLFPGHSYFFSNSGAEANEAAIKLARKYHSERNGAEKTEIIGFSNAFHGRTMMAISVAGNPAHTRGFTPLVPEVRQAVYNDVASLEATVSERTCAIVLEVMQGKGGGAELQPAMVAALEAARRRHGALLIVDEVQTGLGRLGSFFGFQQFGFEPDIVTMAKGLGGGLPIGLTMVKAGLASALGPGSHGSTFGGNPLASAVAAGIVMRVSQPGCLARVRTAGQMLREDWQAIATQYCGFGPVRGRGLMLSANLRADLAGRAEALRLQAEAEGLLIRTAGPDTIRITPPLNISDTEISAAGDCLRRALMEVSR